MTTVMTMENYHTQMGMAQKLAERYTEYGSAHDQSLYYPYEPSSPGHVTSIKHHIGGGGYKNNAAMSALTLLAFLFFLHILQSCLKDHMTAMSTPQVMIMTGGREGEENIAKYNKIDKTGEMEEVKQNINRNDETVPTDSEKYLTKITSSGFEKNYEKNPFNRKDYPRSSEFISVNNY